MIVNEQTERIAYHNSLADAMLVAFGSGGLLKKVNKSYVVLERKTGRSDQNKNAVGFIREGVTFMVPDWTDEQAAAAELGLQTKRSTAFPRLVFVNLKVKDVEKNSAFFARLVQRAKSESERLQTTHSH